MHTEQTLTSQHRPYLQARHDELLQQLEGDFHLMDMIRTKADQQILSADATDIARTNASALIQYAHRLDAAASALEAALNQFLIAEAAFTDSAHAAKVEDADSVHSALWSIVSAATLRKMPQLSKFFDVPPLSRRRQKTFAEAIAVHLPEALTTEISSDGIR